MLRRAIAACRVPYAGARILVTRARHDWLSLPLVRPDSSSRYMPPSSVLSAKHAWGCPPVLRQLPRCHRFHEAQTPCCTVITGWLCTDEGGAARLRPRRRRERPTTIQELKKKPSPCHRRNLPLIGGAPRGVLYRAELLSTYECRSAFQMRCCRCAPGTRASRRPRPSCWRVSALSQSMNTRA